MIKIQLSATCWYSEISKCFFLITKYLFEYNLGGAKQFLMPTCFPTCFSICPLEIDNCYFCYISWGYNCISAISFCTFSLI